MTLSFVEAMVALLLAICKWNYHSCETVIAEVVKGDQPMIMQSKSIRKLDWNYIKVHMLRSLLNSVIQNS